jgi:alpha-tubulin suppressor-like RCC1 family protein
MSATLVYPDILPGNVYTNILLIDNTVKNNSVFFDSVNSSTFPIKYSYDSSRSELMQLLQNNFTNISRIAICSENNLGMPQQFLNNEFLFSDNEATPYSDNVQFIINIIKQFNVKNIDFLACNTLNYPNYVNYYNIITSETGVTVGASNNTTGNIQYGGDWVMESTSQDIEVIYFTQSIEYYSYLLGSVGGNSTIILASNNNIYGYGSNDNGQFTVDPSQLYLRLVNTVPAGKTIKSVSCGSGSAHTIVLMTDGTVYGCGLNTSGQLGIGNTTNQRSLVPMTNTTGKEVKSVSCGGAYTIVVMTDGTVYGCGSNDYGQLGITDNTVNQSSLTLMTSMPANKTAKYVSCGGAYTIVVMNENQNNSVYGCGRNSTGQLGIGSYNYTPNSSLVPITSMPANKTAKSVSCGTDFTIIIMNEDNSVYGCGSNDYSGQLGLGNLTNQRNLVPITSMPADKTAQSVSCSQYATKVLMTDGTVYVCGENTTGQLGIGTTTGFYRTLVPMSTVPADKKAQSVSSGSSYTIVVMTDGTVYGCGRNSIGSVCNGHLGIGDTGTSFIGSLTQMINIPADKKAQSVYCGTIYTMVLMTDNSFYGCGVANSTNNFGQLGFNYAYFTNSVMLTNNTGKTPKYISYGYNFEIVLMTDGSVYGCGNNGSGQLGIGNTTNQYNFTQMPLPSGKTAKSVSCGNNFTIVLMTDGTVYGCGRNAEGQLGITDNTTQQNSLVPMTSMPTDKIAKSVSCGQYFTIILMQGGTIYGCGQNNLGQLGITGNTVNQSSLTLMSNLPTNKIPQYISCGANHTTVLMTDGTVYGCGSNNNGQLTIEVSTLYLRLNPSIPADKTVKSVSGGENHTIVVMTDGTVYGCGYNFYGQLGIGNTTDQYSLTPMTSIPAGKKAQSVSCGYNHTIVLMEDGTVYGCGYNFNGQLGIGGNTSNQLSLIQMTNMPTGIGKTPKSVSCGPDFTIVVMNDGTVYGCGYNFYGNLGNNSTTNTTTLTPMTSMPAGKKAQYVSCGSIHTIVLMEDGTVYGCGYNLSGQLGINSYSSKSSLTQMTNMPTGIGKTPKSVSCCKRHTIVLMADGTVYGCGDNFYGQLGDNSRYNDRKNLVPMTNTTGKEVKSVSCGENYTIVRMADGTVYGCGDNLYGQFGNNSTTNTTTLTLMTSMPADKTAQSVSCGKNFTIVVMNENNSVYGCGNNLYGQLGFNYGYFTNLFMLTNNTGKTPKYVSCGANFISILMNEDNSIYSCGQNANGQFGIGNTTDQFNLTQMTNNTGKPPKYVSCGENYSIVQMIDGTVYGCGQNNVGQLGNGNTTDQLSLVQMNIPNFIKQIFNTADVYTDPCFKEDTQILTDKGYLLIQNLRKGDLVKTLKHGYLPIDMIGTSKMYNSGDTERIKNRLYNCSKEKYSGLFEDLVITGCHSILFDEFTEEQKIISNKYLNNIFKIDDQYALPSCFDKNAEPYNVEGTFNIYHIALKNEDDYTNYGIYANGLLVESCSKHYLKETANMHLLG